MKPDSRHGWASSPVQRKKGLDFRGISSTWKDSPNRGRRRLLVTHPIVIEELRLLERVCAALELSPVMAPPSEVSVVDDLERIREQLLRGEMDYYERSALNTRWLLQTALLRQLRDLARRTIPRRSPTAAVKRPTEPLAPPGSCLDRLREHPVDAEPELPAGAAVGPDGVVVGPHHHVEAVAPAHVEGPADAEAEAGPGTEEG